MLVQYIGRELVQTDFRGTWKDKVGWTEVGYEGSQTGTPLVS